jgi:hypothetical protein
MLPHNSLLIPFSVDKPDDQRNRCTSAKANYHARRRLVHGDPANGSRQKPHRDKDATGKAGLAILRFCHDHSFAIIAAALASANIVLNLR